MGRPCVLLSLYQVAYTNHYMDEDFVPSQSSLNTHFYITRTIDLWCHNNKKVVIMTTLFLVCACHLNFLRIIGHVYTPITPTHILASMRHNIIDDYVNEVKYCMFKGSLYMMIQVQVYIMHTFLDPPIPLYKYGVVCCQPTTMDITELVRIDIPGPRRASVR